MPCYHPLDAYRSKDVNSSGKRGFVFNKHNSLTGIVQQLPCGRCVGCRLERSRQWAVRCMHEKQVSSHSFFLTLSYGHNSLPEGGTLVKRDLQLFMKRVRKKYGAGVRFYACGEYGDRDNRPHYHVLLFNVPITDLVRVGTSKTGDPLYSSDVFRDLWGHGHIWIGSVDFKSAAYVARYILKKVNGEFAEDYYQVLTPYGEIVDRVPEFTVMSRRPGIAAAWFQKYHRGVMDWDSVIIDGHEMKPPRFYDEMANRIDSDHLERVSKARRRRAKLRRADSTVARLRVREVVELRKLAFYSKRL